MLHSLVSVSSPEHCSPPLAGAGLEHDRYPVLSPPPQGFEHVVQSLKSLQPPSTGDVKCDGCDIVRNSFTASLLHGETTNYYLSSKLVVLLLKT